MRTPMEVRVRNSQRVEKREKLRIVPRLHDAQEAEADA